MLIAIVDKVDHDKASSTRDFSRSLHDRRLVKGSSPAINMGNNDDAPFNVIPFVPPIDQRGFSRISQQIVDIGAVESTPEPVSIFGLVGITLLGTAMLRKTRRKRLKI